MKKILAIALLLSLLANLYLLMGGLSHAPEQSELQGSKAGFAQGSKVEPNIMQPHDSGGSEQDKIIQDLNDKLIAARNNVSGLEAKVESLELELAALKLDDTDSQDTVATSKSKGDSGDSPFDNMTLREMQEQNNAQLDQYENDSINQDWAYQTQRGLSDMISDSDLLSKFSLNEIRCKSTSCRLSVSPLQEGSAGSIGAYFDFIKVLKENEKYSEFKSMSQNDEETGSVNIYLTEPKDDK